MAPPPVRLVPLATVFLLAMAGGCDARKSGRRRRVQGSAKRPACGDMTARAQAVMDVCCPAAAVSPPAPGPGGGHRRTQAHKNCQLPTHCPSLACAIEFTSFVDQCSAFV
eukprot:COSAG01_NODE_14789_length_1409_cov_22.230769_2_plen_110_part_00